MMAAEVQVVDPQIVGNSFVEQYYKVLHQYPELVHRFYQDSSFLSRPGPDSVISSVTTMNDISEAILAMEYQNYQTEILTVDAQISLSNGIIVLVTGYLTRNEDKERRKFTQSFFLAPQENGFFVLNDIFRCVDDYKSVLVPQIGDIVDQTPSTIPLYSAPDHFEPNTYLPVNKRTTSCESLNDTTTYFNPTFDPVVIHSPTSSAAVYPKKNFEKELVLSDDHETTASSSVVLPDEVVGSGGDDVVNIPVQVQVPVPVAALPVAVPVVLNENDPIHTLNQNDPIHTVNDIDFPRIQDVLPRKSFASIVHTLKENNTPFRARAPPTVYVERVESSQGPAAAASGASNINGLRRNNTVNSAPKYSIFVANLPLDVTTEQVREIFIKFGPIRSPNGVQVRSNKLRPNCFAFVDFESPASMYSALKASPIIVGNRKAFIEEKKGNDGVKRNPVNENYPSHVNPMIGWNGTGHGMPTGHGRGEGDHSSMKVVYQIVNKSQVEKK